MRTSMIATTGLKLARTPSVRDLTRRRRLTLLAGLLALASVGAAAGFLTTPHAPDAAPFGPFSDSPR